jgi:uncharacterized protein YfaS (alpha-2-macroglobulin family)
MKQSFVDPVFRLFTAKYRRLFFPLLVLLLVSLSCSMPDLSRRSTDITQPTTAFTMEAAVPVQPGIAEVQPTSAVNYPPTLVETDPLPSSELAPGQSPVFYFSQPMERASVEASFDVQPEVSGRFEWLDDSAVRFVPATSLTSGSSLNVTIRAGAKAANGLALAEPVQVKYQAAGPLQLAERLPAPDALEVNPSSAVVVTFTRPVVSLGAGAQGLPAAFSLTPEVAGRGEWLNTSTYIFYPEPGLMGGTSYTVRLNSDLTSTDGSPLAEDTSLEWSFSTSSPVLLSVTPGAEQPVLLDSAFTLSFNQPMDRSSVESEFSLISQNGEPVVGKFTWNETGSEVTFTPAALLNRATMYTIALFGTARGQGGAPLGQDFAAALTTVPQFTVTETRPAAGETLNAYGGYGSISLVFSSPVAAGQNFADFISIDPPVIGQSISRDYASGLMFVSGYFAPSTSYTLTVQTGLRDRWGAALDSPFSFTFKTQPASPSLTIPVRDIGGKALFIPQNETGLEAQSINIERVVLSRGKLTLSEFIQADRDWEGLKDWEAKVQSSWPVLLYPEPNVTENVTLPLTQNGGTLDPGLYFLNVEPQPTPDQEMGSPSLLVVSPIQMVLKISARQVFVWAVKVPENTPLADAAITIHDANSTTLGSCITDARGACEVALPARDDPYGVLYAMHGQPGDPDFSLVSSTWLNGVSPWDFGLNYQDLGSRPQIYLYTDRPIYRPGQEVNFRVVVRDQENGRYALSQLDQVTLEVLSPYDPVSGLNQILTTLRLPLDEYGAAASTYLLPADARPGSYILRVLGDQANPEIYFEVAEYRKPEIDLQVAFGKSGALAGEDLQAQVSAKYFFGAPAGNLPVRWSLFRKRGYLFVPGNLSVGKADTSWLSPWEFFGGSDTYIMEGQSQTGPDGTVVINISGQDLLGRLDTAAENLQELTLQVTIEDESGLPVSGRGTMQLHPSPFYVGVNPEQWSVQAGQEITYTIRSVDWQGGPVGDKPLSALFRKVVWVQEGMAGPYMMPSYRTEYTDIGSTDFSTSAQGDARLAFIPPEPGTYMLQITGESGVITQVISWVGGPGATAWPNLPNQRLMLRSDADSYIPGQTARIFIPNPFEGEALALITVERGKVMRSFIEKINEASFEMQLPLGGEDAPNIYLSVTLLGRSADRPDMRQGYLDLRVDPSAQLLDVEIETSPQQPQPGGELTVNIRVKDAQGNPVQGAFSLALVDKAVLALAGPNSPAIEQAFYGKQPLGVRSSFSLANYSGRFVYAPPGRGGGGGAAQETSTVRSKFEDTAYWNGSIQTDVTGVAQVQITLPDNLTTWHADVRGLTANALVGQGQADLVTGKPLLVRPVAPRFVVLGDHLELAAVVHNNTQETLQASVRLESAGFSPDDPNQAAQGIELPAGGQVRVSWWGTVQDVASLDLTFSAEAAAYEDAARPELNPIPVLRYTASQTFGTSGILNDAGERLELVSLPRSFTPVGAELRVELSPSMLSAVLDSLEALESYPFDFTEPILSRLLPNLAAHQALNDYQLQDQTLRGSLETAIADSIDRLVRLQQADGGWGWSAGAASDAYISTYALLGLNRAAQAGFFVDPQVLEKGKQYLLVQIFQPTVNDEPWKLDRLAFTLYVLQSNGDTNPDMSGLYEFKEKLSPWGKAFLALAIEGQQAGDARAQTLISDLQAAASRSASGANWQDDTPNWRNWSTPNFTTAVVTYAIARMDPASQVLNEAVRYLVLHRRPSGVWNSSYETSWVLLALLETARTSGDLQAQYAYSAEFNGSPLIEGRVENPVQAVNAAHSTLPMSSLLPDVPNALLIQRGEGSGRLFYRAHLQVSRPADEAPAVQRGLTIERHYYRAGQDCRKQDCQPIEVVDLTDPQPVLARLTLTVPEDMYYVVVEDSIPAGAEILNPRLKTSQQNIVPVDGEAPPVEAEPYDLENPFAQGWGWWRFKDPQVYDDHLRWVVDFLPAGTYELTYRLTPYLAGEFRVLPARAWQYYFPEVEGAGKGSVLPIR